MRFIRQYITIVKEAVKATWAAKSRAILSAVCIGIGIASITVVVALGAAALKLVNSYMEMYGTDSLLIISWNPKSRRQMTLTPSDVDGLRVNFPDAYLVAPQRFHPGLPISFRGTALTSEVDGISVTLQEEWNWKVAEGRDFIEHDHEFAASVCIIGDYVHEVLFERENAIGEFITLGRGSCEVIGVAEKKTFGGMDATANTFVMIPDRSFAKKFPWTRNRLMMMRMRFYDPASVDKQAINVEQYLRHAHKLDDDVDNDFILLTPSAMTGIFMAILGAIGAFLGIITLVIVVVGGFVTANLFMLATQTRIKEIGIRRAFGATARDIFKQFISEFIVVIMLGMFVGLAIGWGAAKFISTFDIVTLSITPGVFGITAFISMLIALTFGILPARSAAKINPIEAIRAVD